MFEKVTLVGLFDALANNLYERRYKGHIAAKSQGLTPLTVLMWPQMLVENF